MTSAASLSPVPDSAAHLLVVDDDSRIRTLLAKYLGQRGYRVSVAENAETALALLASMAFDLLIVDVMMPGMNGLDLAQTVRTRSGVPIILLTARAGAADRIAGLERGVDDYVVKPFEPQELLLRIAAVLRRARPPEETAPPSGPVRFGPYVFDAARETLTREGQAIKLTQRENALLTLLAARAGETVSRMALADGDAAGERAVDVQMARLRRKLGDNPTHPRWLVTVRGAGYRLRVEG